jgi:isopenicillin-N N-acyltransferase-like protein
MISLYFVLIGGLGVVAMSLWSTNEVFSRDSGKYPNGWVPASLLRRMFLEAPTFPLGLRAILATPRHVAMNVILATGEDEALNIELTPDSYFITQVPLEKEILTHSNHFKSEAFKAKDSVAEGSRGGSSLFRDRRVEKVLYKAWPNISEKHFQEGFRDHVGYPNSVCEHSCPKELAWTSAHSTDTTAASVIFNLSKRTMLLCKGPPCQGTYKEYTFNFSLP